MNPLLADNSYEIIKSYLVSQSRGKIWKMPPAANFGGNLRAKIICYSVVRIFDPV